MIGSRRTTLVSALVAVLATASTMLASAPASAADVRVRHTLFGMHDGSGGSRSYHAIHEGAVRLWDVGVQWRQIEVARGRYDWTRLDNLVSAAQAAHVEVTMVVAMTPSFYASSATSPPRNIDRYQEFVRALMKRYRSFHGTRGIAAYQVWNEGNIRTFWTGSAHRLARLTRAMDHVRDQVDPRAKVVGPAMVTRLPYELDGLARFYRQRVGGVPVWRFLDAVGLSLYPQATYGGRAGVPEDSMRLLHQARTRLRRDGVPRSKPVWNTEVNYGLGAGSAAKISDARQASNVMRTYLLNAANGVKRVFWYRYDWGLLSTGGTLGNTLLTRPTDSAVVTPAGHAVRRAQHWMHGRLLGTKKHPPCRTDRQGTYTCIVRDSSGKRWIYWNPFHRARVRLPKGVHHLQGVLGGTQRVTPHSTIRVRFKPVMVHR